MWRTTVLISLLAGSLSVQAQSLITTGEGTARWGFIKLYDAKLKLPETVRIDEVLADHVPAQLELCYARRLTVANFVDGANHALADDLPQQQREAVDRLHAAYQPVNKDDCYLLEHDPELGTALKLNGHELVRIATPGFKAVYFGIWLGEHPLSDNLKTQLLGVLANKGAS
ncbi:MAG: chalcone isomerase family protein [Thiomicrospira sp.]|uniref:chalcone isomerase family protein n=1 Tax=Thiomicrospira sp. TaxID=935 RepID=UPI001A09845B|nr:chalcone isomerase family protein [Thiomicrospira sp.]MBE0493316.1 chalcone isomerase family protein [Thiomicrospira sp.]